MKIFKTPEARYTFEDWMMWTILTVGYGGWFCVIMQAYRPQ